MVWNLFPFKDDFSFGTSQKSQSAKSGLYGGWVTWVIWCQKSSVQDVIHKQAHCHNEAAKNELPVIVAFWVIQIVSPEECSSLMQNLLQISCSTCSVILNAMATQCTGSLNGVYCPPDQYCEDVIVHVCAFQSTLLGCQVTLILHLTMVGLFLDRPHIYAILFCISI